MNRHHLTLLLALIALAAFPRPTFAANEVALQAEVFPDHGLPAIAPTLKVTLTNIGNEPVTIPFVNWLMDVTGPNGHKVSLGCGDDSDLPCGDYSAPWFDRTQKPGPFTLRPRESKAFYVGALDNGAFYKESLLSPGRYNLQVRLGFEDLTSNAFSYTVDQPTGEDQAIWPAIRDQLHEFHENSVVAFMSHHLANACAAHPTSAYAKIWHTFDEMNQFGQLTNAQKIGRLMADTAGGLPLGWDIQIRFELAMQYQDYAEELANAGSMASALDQAEHGRAVLKALQSGYGPYAKDSAQGLLKSLPWTRDELQKIADEVTGNGHHEVKRIEPKVECILKNPDGTYAVWFGYDNPNNGILMFEVGPDNGFSPSPQGRGQTTVFKPGRQRKTFSVAIKRGEKLTWTLNGHHVDAEAQGDGNKCDDGNDQGDDAVASKPTR